MNLVLLKSATVGGLNRIWQRYLFHLDRKPGRMHALNTCFLMSAGDFMAQMVLEKRKLAKYDFLRTIRFAVGGLFIFGPGMHVWYRSLDKLVVGGGKGLMAFKKMLADQALFLPFYLVVFVFVMGAMRGDKTKEIREKLARDIRPMLAASYSVWPAVQLVNFYLVPLKHRILVINIVCLLWNSYIGWKAEEELDTVQIVQQIVQHD